MRRTFSIGGIRPIALAGLLALGSGCNCGGSATSPTTIAPTTGAPAFSGSVSWEIRGEQGNQAVGSASTSGGDLNAVADAGKNHLEIHGNKLTVNGRDAGQVKDGDKIVVEQDGQVTINGTKRETKPAAP